MNKSWLGYDFKTSDNVPVNWNSLFFRKLLALLEKVLQISFIAKLGNYITIIDSTVDVMAFHNIYVIKFFKGIDLSFEHLTRWSIFNWLEVNNFNSNLFSIFLIDSSKYAGAVSFAD